jgi:hypothetical protein
MALIKMGAAARRAGAGSTNTIRRALNAAGIPLVAISPGNFGVEEEDLNSFLQKREDDKALARANGEGAKPPKKSAKTTSTKTENKILKSKKRRG